ncbi:hypothetical protein [Nitrosospira sp. Nsp2]|uniref:hypothetical protein n=1 Tax=Nitrosospira sp. Nsp2 TaxID=136548 RepID=UPI0015E6B188|nr:hypothetical protein [Nitrosospira sp. Nsp2]
MKESAHLFLTPIHYGAVHDDLPREESHSKGQRVMRQGQRHAPVNARMPVNAIE